jgi:hypothetical protein
MKILLMLCTEGLFLGLFMTGQAFAAKATGPLRVHPANPRHFTDGSGRAAKVTATDIAGDASSMTFILTFGSC